MRKGLVLSSLLNPEAIRHLLSARNNCFIHYRSNLLSKAERLSQQDEMGVSVLVSFGYDTFSVSLMRPS